MLGSYFDGAIGNGSPVLEFPDFAQPVPAPVRRAVVRASTAAVLPREQVAAFA